MQQWELLVLQVLNWDLSAVTPYTVLDQLLRSLPVWHREEDPDLSPSSDLVRRHAETFVALAATEHSFCRRPAAVVAVASLGAALRGLGARDLQGVLRRLTEATGVEKVKKCGNVSFFTDM